MLESSYPPKAVQISSLPEKGNVIAKQSIALPSSIATFLPGASSNRTSSGQLEVGGHPAQPHLQVNMLYTLQQELRGGVFQSTELLQRIFCLQERAKIPDWQATLESVVKALSQEPSSHQPDSTWGMISALRKCRLNSERVSYEPLVKLLNYIMEASPSRSPSVLPKLEIIVWDKEEQTSRGKPNMLIQIASYGRALLRHRWYAFVIAYNQDAMTLVFTLFTRQGMFVSPNLSLEPRKPGLTSDLPVICSTLFGLRLSSPYQLGLHPLIYASGAEIRSILIPGASSSSPMEWRQIEKVLCQRDGVRGRGTIVFVIAPAGAVLAEERKDDVAGPQSTGKRKAKTDLRDAPDAKRVKPDLWQPCPISAVEWWNTFISQADLDLGKALQDSVKDLQIPCEQLVVKVSSALSANVDAQVGMWEAAQGMHGVLDVRGTMKLKHGLDIFRDLSDIECIPNWTALYHDNDPPLQVEDRTELITIMKDNGISLNEVNDMRTVVKGIIDAVIGHCNCFEKGYLQRDVSSGNLLLLSHPQDRLERMSMNSEFVLSMDFLAAELLRCTCVLIDSDAALEWRKPRLEKINDRSGTIPFVSVSLCDMWWQNRAVLHTAMDDLESFVWVLLWQALQTAPSKMAAGWLADLNDARLKTVRFTKIVIIQDFIQNKVPKMALPRAVKKLCPLLKRLFQECATYPVQIDDLIARNVDLMPEGEDGEFTLEQEKSRIFMAMDETHRDQFVPGLELLCRKAYRSFLTILVEEYQKL